MMYWVKQTILSDKKDLIAFIKQFPTFYNDNALQLIVDNKKGLFQSLVDEDRVHLGDLVFVFQSKFSFEQLNKDSIIKQMKINRIYSEPTEDEIKQYKLYKRLNEI